MKPANFRQWILDHTPEDKKHIVENAIKEYQQMTDEQKLAEKQLEEDEARKRQLTSFRSQAFVNCGLEGDQWDNTFKNYKPRHYTQRMLLQDAQQFAIDFPQVEQGLFLWGEPGRGKDHILDAIVQTVLDNEHAVLRPFKIYSLDIERRMLDEWSRHNDEETRLEEIMRECDLLCIGDLHLIFSIKTAAVLRAVDRVINHAEATGSPIVCATSNVPLGDFDEFSDRLGSRLCKLMKAYHIEGPDMRRAVA